MQEMQEIINRYLYDYYVKKYTELVYLLFSNILSELEFENLFHYVMRNNSDFSKYLILKTFEPEQLKKFFTNKEIKFFETDKINSYIMKNLRFLEPLYYKLIEAINCNPESLKNYSKFQLYALFLNDPDKFKKARKEISNKFTLVESIVNEEQKLKKKLSNKLAIIKETYTQKKINTNDRKKLENILREEESKIKEEKEIYKTTLYYHFSKSQFSIIEQIDNKVDIVPIIKLYEKQKIDKSLYYKLTLQEILSKSFKILNDRYLYNKKNNEIEIYDLYKKTIINRKFSKIENKHNLLFIGEKDYNISIFSNSEEVHYYHKNNIEFNLNKTFWVLSIMSISGFLLYKDGDSPAIILILFFNLAIAILSLFKFRKNRYVDWWDRTVNEHIDNQKKNNIVNNNLEIINNLQCSHFVYSNSSKFSINYTDNFCRIFKKEGHDFKTKFTLTDLLNMKIVENIEKEKESLQKNLANQVSNLSDANQIMRIKANYRNNLSSIISLDDAVSVIYNAKNKDINNVEIDIVLQQVFNFKYNSVNNFILIKLNELRYQINDKCMELLKNYCNDELLLLNVSISCDVESLYKLININSNKKFKHWHYIYFEIVINKHFLDSNEKINLETMHKIKKKLKPVCSKTKYLVNRLDYLHQIVGKRSKTIKINNENKAESKDIEIKK